MDKNFFKFDIDDEVLSSSEKKVAAPQKPQNICEIIEKTEKNNDFFCFGAKIKGSRSSNVSYQKNEGLSVQREINSVISKVEDYVNFDFRIKEKLKNNKIVDNCELGHINFDDEQVQRVIEKTQIGVIFY